MSAPPTLTARCWGKACSRLMTWTRLEYWAAKCSCGFSTRAASGDAMMLDKRLEQQT